MHDVQRRLAREVRALPLLGPRAAVVDRAAGRGRELADQIDLHVGLLRPRHERDTCVCPLIMPFADVVFGMRPFASTLSGSTVWKNTVPLVGCVQNT